MQDNNNGVYFIMTSNDVSQLPPELTRAGRLDSQWFFNLPSAEDREEIFKIHFNRYGRSLDKEVMATAVATTNNFTGAEIAEVVKNTMRKAFLRISKNKKEKKDINITDIKDSVLEVTPVFESNREKVQALRNWVKGRARFTDGSSYDSSNSNDSFDPFDNGLSL